MNNKSLYILLTALVVASTSYFIFLDKDSKKQEKTPDVNKEKTLQESDVIRIVENYINQNPKVIIKSIENYYAEQEKESKMIQKEKLSLLKDQIYNTVSDPIIGNPKGKFKLVEFFDYNCGYCARMAPIIQQLIAEYPELQIIMKEMPILGEKSILASKAALSVNIIDNSKYKSFSSSLIALQDKSEDSIMKMAAAMGIDTLKLKETMQKPEIENMIQANIKMASELQIKGVPALILGDDFISDRDFNSIKNLLEAMGAKRTKS